MPADEPKSDPNQSMEPGVSNNAKKTGPFDVKTVESLVALMTEHDLSVIYLRDGNQTVRLRRTAAAVAAPATLPAAPAPIAAPAVQTVPTPSTPAPAKSNLIEIKSETVGVFFLQAKPGEPPYVKVGDRVTPDKQVGVIMVMKTHNEVLANCTGIIREILVGNDQAIEFGQVLFRVEPT